MSSLSGEALKQIIRGMAQGFVDQFGPDIQQAFEAGHNAAEFAQAFQEELP